ncbi:hypothetical protein L1887_05528 [Cichorium endivia]|nr:hypothetical protein L1887_05528 [Cichorium endivia]
MLLSGCNLLCHVGVLLLHLMKGGCNGIGAWGFNSVLNFAILFLFLNFYVKSYMRKKMTKSSPKLAMLIRFRVGVDYSFHTTKRDSDGSYLLPTLRDGSTCVKTSNNRKHCASRVLAKHSLSVANSASTFVTSKNDLLYLNILILSTSF